MSSAPIQPAPRPAIRSGGARDLDAVMDVMTSAFRPCFGEGWTRSQCAGILPMHGVTLRLAGDPAHGFYLSRTVLDEAELLLIAVADDAQGQGLGSALLDDFIDVARQDGAHYLHLEVRDGNPALSLYLRHGFRIVGRREHYYKGKDGTRHDAVTLALKD